jgi:hypothetical protein
MRLTDIKTDEYGAIIHPELTDLDLSAIEIKSEQLRLQFSRYDFDCYIEFSGAAAFTITNLSSSSTSLTLHVLATGRLSSDDRTYVVNLLDKCYHRDKVNEILQLFDDGELTCFLNDPSVGSDIVVFFKDIKVFFAQKE